MRSIHSEENAKKARLNCYQSVFQYCSTAPNIAIVDLKTKIADLIDNPFGNVEISKLPIPFCKTLFSVNGHQGLDMDCLKLPTVKSEAKYLITNEPQRYVTMGYKILMGFGSPGIIFKFGQRIVRPAKDFKPHFCLMLKMKILEGSFSVPYWFQSKDNLHVSSNLLDKYSNSLTTMTSETLSEVLHDRHNVLHGIVCDAFGIEYLDDRKFSIKDFDTKLTPDIYCFSKNKKTCLWGDVSIAQNPARIEQQKAAKYESLSISMRLLGKMPIPLLICLDPSLDSLLPALTNSPLPLMHNIGASIVERFKLLNRNFSELLKEGGFTKTLRELFPDQMDGIDFEGKLEIPKNNEFVISMQNAILKPDISISDLKKMAESPEMDGYKDKIFTEESIVDAIKWVSDENSNYTVKNKPSHYIPIQNFDYIKNYSNSLPLEQSLIVEMARDVSINGFDFERELFTRVLRSLQGPDTDYNMSVFTTGECGVDGIEKYRSEFRAEHSIRKISFDNYLLTKGIVVPDRRTGRFVKRKIYYMNANVLSSEARQFYDKSGVNFKRRNPEGRNISDPNTSSLNGSIESCEEFSRLMMEESTFNLPSEIFNGVGSDEKTCKVMKEDILKAARNVSSNINKHFLAKYMWYQSLFFEQLIHFQNFNLDPNHFTFLNSGNTSVLTIMISANRGLAHSQGAPFCTIGYTDNPKLLNLGFYGNVKVKRVSETLFFFRTGWARLPTHRLEFLRDQFYSLYSSTICSINRVGFDSTQLIGIGVIRALIGFTSTQKVAERLADARYIMMSALSEFTNFEELIKDKFAPPYHNQCEAWIVLTALNNSIQFRRSIKESGAVKIFRPKLDGLSNRTVSSVGGQIHCKGFWSNRTLKSMQDILDELFLYVHTAKEPSVEFHEEINAIKTINKFQTLHENMSNEEKVGKHPCIMDFLKKMPKMGFNLPTIVASTKMLCDKYSIEVDKQIELVLTETVGDLISTKAVVPEGRVTKPPTDNRNINFVKMIHDKVAKKYGVRSDRVDYSRISEKSKNNNYKNKTTKKKNRGIKSSGGYHSRVKVFDSVLESLEKFDTTLLIEQVLSHLENGGEMLADICIKAQYGAKREFYVMNYGAKNMARIVENFFSRMCSQVPEEMISVGGDDKMIHMQRMLSKVTKHAQQTNNFIYYVNGDCTKWSASELLEVFQVICMSMKDKYDKKFFDLLISILSCWADKRIQVPKRIVDKVYPMLSSTEYLSGLGTEKFQIKSTQNFLQGVFNYLSSFKAAMSCNYTREKWKEIYPESKLHFEYLVHSDDYVLCVSSPSKEEFVLFRKFFKICQKLHNIHDSTKKTNCQHYFMEFISLIAFNASLSYPTIKKTKEVATTFPCESFKQDSDMVCSRTAEVIRIGTDISSAYIFHRIHMYLLRRVYSMHQHGVNDIGHDYLNIPVGMYGQSDMLPLFYFLCNGDPNNTRILTYTDNTNMLGTLLDLGKNLGDTGGEMFGYPTFLYNRYTEKVNQLRLNSGTNAIAAMEYWRGNPFLNFVKPKCMDDLVPWMKSMYFKGSFVKAYNRDSRTIRLLRLSGYSRNKCVSIMSTDELNAFYHSCNIDKTLPVNIRIELSKDVAKLKEEKLSTIIESFNILLNRKSNYDISELRRACYGGDSTIEAIYLWMDTVNVEKTDSTYMYNTVACKAPNPPIWMKPSSKASNLVSYLCDRDFYSRNYRNEEDIGLLEKDIRLIDSNYPGLSIKCVEGSPESKMFNIQILYNIITQSSSRRTVCMSNSMGRPTMGVYLKNLFRFNYTPGFVCNVTSYDATRIVNPYTLEDLYNMSFKNTGNLARANINNIGLLYVCLNYYLKLGEAETLRILSETTVSLSDTLNSSIPDFLSKSMGDHIFEEWSIQEQQVLGFLLAKLSNDHSGLDYLISRKESFVYKGDYSAEKATSIIKFKYMYRSNICSAFYNRNKGLFYCKTNCKNPQMIPLITGIGMKLCGLIHQYELDRILTVGDHKPLLKNWVAFSNGTFCVQLFGNIEFRRMYVGTKYTGYPCCIIEGDLSVMDSSGFIDYGANFYRTDGMSVFKGKLKMFTFPVKRLAQTSAPIWIRNNSCRYNTDLLLSNKNMEKWVRLKVLEGAHFDDFRHSDFECDSYKPRLSVNDCKNNRESFGVDLGALYSEIVLIDDAVEQDGGMDFYLDGFENEEPLIQPGDKLGELSNTVGEISMVCGQSIAERLSTVPGPNFHIMKSLMAKDDLDIVLNPAQMLRIQHIMSGLSSFSSDTQEYLKYAWQIFYKNAKIEMRYSELNGAICHFDGIGLKLYANTGSCRLDRILSIDKYKDNRFLWDGKLYNEETKYNSIVVLRQIVPIGSDILKFWSNKIPILPFIRVPLSVRNEIVEFLLPEFNYIENFPAL